VTGGRDQDAEARQGDIYRRIGVEPVINGRSTFTILGGSLMAPEVLEAMRQASECFVDLEELQAAVGQRVARLTRNEAAFVCGGAAAGLFLSAAACMTRGTLDGILRLDELERLPREFVIHRAHRIPYDLAIGLTGGRLVEIGQPEHTDSSELEAALSTSTAAVLYVPKAHLAPSVVPLDTVCALAHARGIPVIVDAAAQLPPTDNLWRFTEAGADLVLFSGGKALCGPASTGLVLGTARYVERLARNAAPLQRLGRPMKVGKEDLVGILAAVEWYLRQDHAALAERYEAQVRHLVAWGRDRQDVRVTIEPLGEAGQPTPRAYVSLVGRTSAERDELLATLRATPPRIDLLGSESGSEGGWPGFYVAPETLRPGEEMTISRRLAEVLDAAGELPAGG
jgi:L-seryl-tRNA(Ser) seleniumtransferase